jgi:hypothetical protein
MTGIYEILKQDFAAAKAAFDQSDPHNLNICANRLMANVVFGDEDDKKYMVPGYFLRIVANDFLAIKDETVAKSAREPAEHFIATIERAFTEQLDSKPIWNGFFEYTERKRQVLLPPTERRAYKLDPSFTARGVRYLTQKFFDDPFVARSNSIVLRALLTEADRLIRNHGAEHKELVVYCLMRALDWLDRYLPLAFADAEKSGSLETVKGDILPYIERMQNWYSGSEELPYHEATEILCDLLLSWRKFFFRYLDGTKVSPGEERRVELPGQVRQRIGETIAQALQRDIGEKGKSSKGKG